MDPNIDLIGDPTWRWMLALLAVEGEVCVCEFVAALAALGTVMRQCVACHAAYRLH